MDLTQRDRLKSLSRPLSLLSAVLTGLSAGGMVFIEVVLVPFWRGTSPAEFRHWFTEHSNRIRALMVPLGAGAGIVSIASAATQHVEHRNRAAVVAAAATAGVVAITVTVNEPANSQFTAGTLTDGETRDLLDKWARWHHLRVGLGVVAAAAATLALNKRMG
jgi:hypothetical protein